MGKDVVLSMTIMTVMYYTNVTLLLKYELYSNPDDAHSLIMQNFEFFKSGCKIVGKSHTYPMKLITL